MELIGLRPYIPAKPTAGDCVSSMRSIFFFCENMAGTMNCNFRIGNGYDVHQLAEGLPMWLGGVRIESPVGFVAHSDGDVAIHALCDALLGCLALGDIGHHFPDTSAEFKGIDSKELLRRVVGLLAERGYAVVNVDVTIALQAPKIGKYVPAMRECLAGVMGVDADCVSVKATTTERLGFVGRCEGCEVWATALICREEA